MFNPARFLAGRRPVSVCIILVCAWSLGLTTAKAQYTITASFDTSITSHPQSATIVATINSAIQEYQTRISTTANSKILFQASASGLGSANTAITTVPYLNYRNALVTRSATTDDATAIATLPNQTNNPVTNTASVTLARALARAMGLTSSNAGNDSTIALNLSIMNLSRSETDPGKYDLKSVTLHEIDHSIGFISTIGTGFTSPGAQDLFRFSAPNVRSFTTDTSVVPYFSINNGVTNIITFNHDGAADWESWKSGQGIFVQNAYGTPGAAPDLAAPELRTLDVIGYNFFAVPEPSTYVLLVLAVGSVGIAGFHYRRRRRAVLDRTCETPEDVEV